MERKQFTFYRSYYEAVKELPKREQTAVLLAICDYALNEREPELTGTAKAVFALARPTLDASRRKAANGKKGGESKQNESKTEANAKQTRSKKEKKKENKKKKEKENECYPPTPLFGPELQEAFDSWLKYKAERREGYKETGLRNLTSEVRNNADEYGEAAVADLIRKCMASNWQGIIFDRLKQNRGKEQAHEEPKRNPGGVPAGWKPASALDDAH